MEISDFQKNIYNSYLKIYAKNNNRGYRKRQDFSSIEEKIKIVLNRLETFFKEHGEINIENFFQAGFTVTHRQYIPLEFFVTFKAISAYKKVGVA